MNAVVLIDKIDEIDYLDSINHLVKSLAIQNSKDNTNHQISLILFMYLLDKYDLKIKDTMLSYRYNKEKFSTSNINFSSSYCDNAVITAISSNNIGIDIEKQVNNFYVDICNKNECQDNYMRIFTLKESFGKYLNVGLNYNYKSINLSSNTMDFYRYGCYFKSIYYEKYIISICSNFERVEFITIDKTELKKFVDRMFTKL